MSEMIRVLLVDDQQTVHDAIAAILRPTRDIRLVGRAYAGEQALALCRQLLPHIVLMDALLLGSAATTADILQEHPLLRVLAIASVREYEYIKPILNSGAVGYLVKDALAADLVHTIRTARRGNMLSSPQITNVVLSKPTSAIAPDFDLTDREQQILELLAIGRTSKQIASTLRVNQQTVRYHLNNLIAKLHVDTRSEALIIAAKNGLI